MVRRLSILFAGLTLLATPVLSHAEAPRSENSFALLVGCTEYKDHPRLRELYGPANDAKVWNTLLTDPKGFAFPGKNVQVLVGWPDDETRRPTYSNIVKGLQDLVAKAGRDSRVVIVMSGHGMQVPIPPTQSPLDPANPEPDGLDEVFLPADVQKADANGQIPNSLRDDQIAGFLDALRSKGANVLIVFDCCHSGTMTRSAPKPDSDIREISRVADPAAFGITPDQIAEASTKARKAVEAEEKRTGKKYTTPGKVGTQPDAAGGSLVAFYAAQPFEEAPELPLPEDAPMTKENYYGLLSYTVMQSLKQRQTPLTYRELAQMVGSYYRAERGVKGPVPYAEGDLDREVLGYNVWPNRSEIVFEKDAKGHLSVNAGTLAGVTQGSILAIHPPGGPDKETLGYVKVQSATIASAIVEPTAFDGQAAVEAGKLPALAPATIAARDYGDLRLKLFLDKSQAATAGYTAIANIGQEGKEILDMLRVVDNEADAEWIVRLATPQEAEAMFAPGELGRNKDGSPRRLNGDHLLLIRGSGSVATAEEANRLKSSSTAAGQRRVFGAYPVGDLKDPKAIESLAGFLARDLPKIFRWQNLWRVASGTAEARSGDANGVKLEVAVQPNEKATGTGELLRSGVVPNNTVLDFRVKNEGKLSLWVISLYLDAEMEISVYDVESVNAGATALLPRGVIEKNPGEFGTEGIVIFAIPQQVQPTKPNFKFLEQSRLAVENRSRSGDAQAAPRNPFGELLKASVIGAGTRAPRTVVDTTPYVLSASWKVVP